jgi:hypothetical protein
MDEDSSPEETQNILSIISMMFCPIAPLIVPRDDYPEQKSLLEDEPKDDFPSKC